MSEALTEEHVYEALARLSSNSSVLRKRLNIQAGKAASNRLAYLLGRLKAKGRATCEGAGRCRIWRVCPEKKAKPKFGRTLVAIDSDWDALVLVAAEPLTLAASAVLGNFCRSLDTVAKGVGEPVDDIGAAFRVMSKVLDLSGSIPDGVQKVIDSMVDIEFNLLISHNVDLTGFDHFISVRCYPD